MAVIVVGASTIQPGAPPSTVYGHVISVTSSAALIGGSTYALPSAQPNGATHISAITLNNGDVLTAGGTPAVVSGTSVGLASNGASLIINGNSFSIPPASPSGSRSSFGPSALMVGGHSFLAASSGFTIGSQIIGPGGTRITISGTVVSLGPSGEFVVGSENTTLPPGGSGIVEIIGGIAIEAPAATGAGGGGAPGAATAQAFTGIGVRVRLTSPCVIMLVACGVSLV